MKTLQPYLAPISIAGESLGDSYKAYKMDNVTQPDMRIDVGLGTCDCCDYFQVVDNNVYLIEDKQLVEKYKNLKMRHAKLDEEQKKELINRTIKMVNRLKVYGSMLVLCRLAGNCKSARKLLANKKYVILLVVSGLTATEDYKFFEYLKTEYLSDLKSQLSSEMIARVEILTPDNLKKKLSINN